MAQRVSHSHAEAFANTIVGSILGQIILWLWGMPLVSAIWLNITFIVVSYLRAFIIRRVFNSFDPSNFWTEQEIKEAKEESIKLVKYFNQCN